MLTDSHISAEIVSRSVRAPSRAARTQETIDTGLSASVREHPDHAVAGRRARARPPAPMITSSDSQDS